MKLPPPSPLVDVGGYRLHVWRAGAGQATVLLDSGLTATSLFHAPVIPGVAGFARVAAFDRAGYPWSDPAPAGQARTSPQIIAEMRSALASLDLPGPYVLVGLSFGAINMLTYALRFPAEVAGLVLVDPSHPEMFTRAQGVPGPKQTGQGLRLFEALARLGLLRLFAGPFARAVLPGWRNMPAEAWAAQLELVADPALYAAAARETDAGEANFAGARAAAGALGDLPLRVLTGEDWGSRGPAAAAKPGMLVLHKELAALSTRGEHILVERSGHVISVDRPDAVVAAIRAVVALAG